VPYVIDGNNLLGSWGGPAVPGDGRHEVVRRVCRFCRDRGARALLVFDGAPFRPDLGGQELGPVALRFAAEGQDADSVIRRIVDEAPRPAEWLVVTSDKALYSYARTRGAAVLRAHEWNALARGPAVGGPAARRRAAGRASSSSREKPERETDVEGWLKRFSGE
jgi:predicted RNA-binding protein with PIN domain